MPDEFVVTDDFLDQEVQEFLGEFRREIGAYRQGTQAGDLGESLLKRSVGEKFDPLVWAW